MQAIQTANLHSVTQNAFLTDELPLTIISYKVLQIFQQKQNKRKLNHCNATIGEEHM